MARNTFHNMSIPALRALATQAFNIINFSPSTYGATAAQMTTLSTLNGSLGSSATAVETAKAALASAIQTQEADKQALVNQVALIAKQAYNKPATDSQIAAAGFAVRDNQRTDIFPVQVLGLAATPNWDGNVKLSWDRNGNPYGVNFFVEASIDGGAWTQVYATKKTRLTLSGYAPGTWTQFRIVAENRGVLATPSNVATIYPESAPAASLQLAA